MTPAVLPIPKPPVRWWRIAALQFWRDARAGSFHALGAALLLAVMAVYAISAFSARFDRALVRDARALTGGDAVVLSDRAWPASGPVAEWVEGRVPEGWRRSVSAQFPSVVRGGEGPWSLAALKAVDGSYPLRGQMRLEGQEGGAPLIRAGEAWADRALLERLGLKVGDQVWVGERELRLAGVIASEPDRGLSFTTLAPRLMIRLEDLASTRLVQPTSRITWRLAVAREQDDAAVSAWVRSVKAWLTAHPGTGLRVESFEDQRPEVKQTLEQARRFLSLVALLSAWLGALAIAMASRQYAAHQMNASALMRVLGLTQAQLILIHGSQLLALTVACVLGGLAFGWLGQQGLMWALSSLLPADLPPAGWMPAALAAAAGAGLMLAFAVMPVLRLAKVPPLRVWRQELGAPPASAWLSGGLGIAGFLVVMQVSATDPWIGLFSVVGLLGSLLVFGLATALFLWALKALRSRWQGPPVWRMATQQWLRQPRWMMLQVAAVSLGWTVLLTLGLLRSELLDRWKAEVPLDTPNRYVFNIQPAEAADVKAALQAMSRSSPGAFAWTAMTRARVVSLRGQAPQVALAPLGEERRRKALNRLEREFNAGLTTRLPEANTLSAGQWQAVPLDDGRVPLSFEAELARDLGLSVGDEVGLQVAGEPVRGVVQSIRQVPWRNMRSNFLVVMVAEPGERWPHQYLATLRTQDREAEARLLQAHPSLTIMDADQILAQLSRVVQQVTSAVQALFLFSLAGGLVVLGTAVYLSRHERQQTYAVMRALGAGRAMLARMQGLELLGIGMLAGGVSGAVAAALCTAFVGKTLQVSLALPWWWWPLSVGGGALLAWGAGRLGLKGLLDEPVVESLRRLGGR